MTGLDRLHVARAPHLAAAAAAVTRDRGEGRASVLVHWAPPRASGAVAGLRVLPVLDLHPVGSSPVRLLDVVALVRAAGLRRTRFHLRSSAGPAPVGAGPDPDPPLELVELTADDAPEVASVHMASFPASALTHLGFDVLHRYYRSMATGDHPAALIGIRRGGRLVGFALIDPERSHLTDYLAARWWALWPRALLRVDLLIDRDMRNRAGIAGSLVARRVATRLRRPRRGPTAAPATRPAPPACSLLAIGVDPALQGHGLGIRLLRAAEDGARARGFDRIRCTVARANDRALALYEGQGWTEAEGGSASQAKMQRVLTDRSDRPRRPG